MNFMTALLNPVEGAIIVANALTATELYYMLTALGFTEHLRKDSTVSIMLYCTAHHYKDSTNIPPISSIKSQTSSN